MIILNISKEGREEKRLEGKKKEGREEERKKEGKKERTAFTYIFNI